MKKQLLLLTVDDADPGFRLAGVEQLATGPAQAPALITELVSDRESLGLLAVDERLVDEKLELHLRRLEENWEGVIVIIPPPAITPVTGEDYAARLIRRAVGYHLRL